MDRYPLWNSLRIAAINTVDIIKAGTLSLSLPGRK